jgi:spermidine synthase
VGVLGLGAGSMASFAQPGDEFRFYEIDPQVPIIATTEFTYYADAPAKKEIVMGDGRLSLEREAPQNYDVLMMDAFSGDSIPVHLVTREAFRVYLRHVKESGVIVVHISNKYLDLEPVLARISEELKLAALVFETDDSWDGNCFGTSYVLFAPNGKTLKEPVFSSGRPLIPQDPVGIWTDDYSNMFHILR